MLMILNLGKVYYKMNAKASWTLLNQYQQYIDFSEKFNVFIQDNIVDVQAQHALNVAVEELITNAIKYNSTDTVSVTVDIQIYTDKIALFISDNGKAFDPEAVRHIDFSQSLDDIPVGGLGLHLVKQSFDSFVYTRKENQNCFELTYLLECD